MTKQLTVDATNPVDRRVGLGLLLVVALLFVITLDNGLRPDELTGGDLITHQYAQVEARPSNAPGYPLYTMGGWLWFRLGRGLLGWLLNPVQILSFYSSLWGLAALAMLYLILLDIFRQPRSRAKRTPVAQFLPHDDPSEAQFTLDLLGIPWLPAALLTAFQAVTFFFWYYSVTTEQYTSAVFQTLLLIWLAFRWDDTPHDALLLAMAFISGTMLANMVTTLFIVPPLLWFVFSREGAEGPFLFTGLRRPKLILLALGATILPLISYVYIYVRGAQHPEWRGLGNWPSTWAWFGDFLTIQQGRDELVPGLTLQNIFTEEFPWLMGWEMTWPVLLGGLLGLPYLGRRRAIFLSSTLAIYFVFCWGYRFGNWFQVIIPAYPIFTIGFGALLAEFGSRYGARQGSGGEKAQRGNGKISVPLQFPTLLIICLLVILLAFRLVSNFPSANQRDQPDDTGLDPGWMILADRPSAPAIISSSFEERVALEYLTRVWGIGPGLIATDAGDFRPPPQIVEPISGLYLTRQAAAAVPESIRFEEVYPQAAGSQLIELPSIPPTRLPPMATPLDLGFGDSLQLIGWQRIEPNLDLPTTAPVPNWSLALFWRTEGPLEAAYTFSVRPLIMGQTLFDGNTPLIQDHQPVWGIYPTDRWTPGAIVRDVYTLNLPPNAKPDAVQIVVYRATNSGFENLGEAVFSMRSPVISD